MKLGNTLAPLLVLLSLLSPGSQVFARDLIRTNPGAVIGTGKNPSAPFTRFTLNPGLYLLSPMDEKWSSELYLLINPYVNDPEKTLAIAFHTDVENGGSDVAYLYQGRPIKGGAEILFSPLAVDNSGNLRVQSETQPDSPIIEVIPRAGDYRYPYVLRGRNGALGSRLYGMRAYGGKRPRLLPSPRAGIFASVTDSRANVMVSDGEISLFSGALAGQTFNLLPMNGEDGKFSVMTKSTFDSMSGIELPDEQIRALATFVDECFDQEKLMILRPSVQWGEYKVSLFERAEPSWLERLFPGLRNPAPDTDKK